MRVIVQLGIDKNFLKKFVFPLDKRINLWYNAKELRNKNF